MMAKSLRASGRTTWATVLACLVIGAVACPAPQAADDDVVADADQARDGPRQPQLLDLGMNFDANLFEQQGNGWVLRSGPADQRGGVSAKPESPALAKGRAMGLRRLERIASCCELDVEQRQRLLLAIESDVRRFAVAVEAIREQYAGRQVDMNDPVGQKEWHAFQQDLLVCRAQLRNLFEAGSLFATVLASTLEPAQRERLAKEDAARRSFHWRAMVLEVTAKLDETVGLDQKQHDTIVSELLAREPPLRTDADSLGRDDPNLRRQLVLMVLAGGDARRIRSAVSERQWRTLSQLMNQGRAMRSWLEQQGVLEGKP
ncbi:MAG: hypothetical protein ACKOCX_03315 [Planctomycetota bacterium]